MQENTYLHVVVLRIPTVAVSWLCVEEPARGIRPTMRATGRRRAFQCGRVGIVVLVHAYPGVNTSLIARLV